METTVLAVESADEFQHAVQEASRLLAAGELVALPTETVYGLAANALNPRAVAAIYSVKGRPAHNPIIVHVSSIDMARKCVTHWPDAAEQLARSFWPGPLTLVLAKTAAIPAVVSAGGDTIGVRLPLHPLMRRVIETCGFPLAAPSANLANQLSPTTADHVLEGLRGQIALVVDAGPTSVGIESTVLDLSGGHPRILRPGMISARHLSEILRVEIPTSGQDPLALKSPGLLKKHYSPRARLQVTGWQNDRELLAKARNSGVAPEAIHIIAHDRIPEANPFGRVAIIPQDAEAYGRAIYAELHRSDQLGAQFVMVEELPRGTEWEGIRDRLTRASS